MVTGRLGPPRQVPAGRLSGGLDWAAFLGEREEGRGRGRGSEEGFVERVRRLGGASRGVGKLGVQAACFVDFSCMTIGRVAWAVSRSECSGICGMSFDTIARSLGTG